MKDIEDIDDFCEKIRNFVFEKIKKQMAIMIGITPEEMSDASEYISEKETLLIVKENCKNKNKISQKIIIKTCEDLNKRIFSNVLNKLSVDGCLDCAWSEKDQSFVFRPTQKGIEKGVTIPEIFK